MTINAVRSVLLSRRDLIFPFPWETAEWIKTTEIKDNLPPDLHTGEGFGLPKIPPTVQASVNVMEDTYLQALTMACADKLRRTL